MRPPLIALRPSVSGCRLSLVRAAAPDVIGAFEQAVGIKQILGDLSYNLQDQLDVGKQLAFDVEGANAEVSSMVLDSLGRDLLVFLAASVVVTPLARAVNVTPILGYLLIGALLGPNGLNVFSNSEADVELGDFGIMFLLFSEGLEVTRERLQGLTKFVPLGLAQLSLTTGVLTATFLLGGPALLGRLIPLDPGVINIQNPAEAFVLACSLVLSTSAFVFPVLKEKGWEEEQVGEAATSILLLQDLAVAPLLVLLPYIVGQGPTDPNAITLLTAKATVGFGSILWVGSLVLRRLFALVAEARSSETFVALCLLVSVGMGAVAKSLGLTDTAGAFAAGVLLANTNYRAQIQADINPFKGILLGVFFMGAGSSFDIALAASEWTTIVAGAIALVLLKGITLFLSTRVPKWIEPNRLQAAQGIRLSLLLAGGGEFAFVVLALAEKLGVLPTELGGLLTAVVLVTMALTPFLGELADAGSSALLNRDDASRAAEEDGAAGVTQVATDAVVVCGFGDVGRAVSRALDASTVPLDIPPASLQAAANSSSSGGGVGVGLLPPIVAFDTNPSLTDEVGMLDGSAAVVCFGDGANPELLRASGVTEPRAIFLTYAEQARCVEAASRLRGAFRSAPIFGRAQTRVDAQALRSAGATEVVVESDELARSAQALLQGLPTPHGVTESAEHMRSIAEGYGASTRDAKKLADTFLAIDADSDGMVRKAELLRTLRSSSTGILSDSSILEIEAWLDAFVPGDSMQGVDFDLFCKMYMHRPACLDLKDFRAW